MRLYCKYKLQYLKIIDRWIYIEIVRPHWLLMKEIQYENVESQNYHLQNIIVHLLITIRLHQTTRKARGDIITWSLLLCERSCDEQWQRNERK